MNCRDKKGYPVMTDKRLDASHGMVCRLPGERFGYFAWPTVVRMDDGAPVVACSGRRVKHINLPIVDLSEQTQRQVFVGRGTDIEWNGASNGVGADLTHRIEPPEDVLKLASREAFEAAITDPIRTVYSPDGRRKLSVSPLGDHELYDLAADPGECRNVVRKPETAGVVVDLLARLRRWQERTGDTVNLPESIGTRGTTEHLS